MTCAEWHHSLMELSRGRLFDVKERDRAVSHVDVCAACRRFFEEQMALTAAETAMADETAGLSLPAELEGVLLAEFDSHARLGRRRFRKSAIATGAIAAALAGAWLAVPHRAATKPQTIVSSPAVATAALPVTPKPETLKAPAPVRRVRRRPAVSPPVSAENAGPFVAIPWTVPLDPLERAAVVRMEMPVAALTAVGLRVATADASANAQADVIVGQDGRMRAIRVLSISNSNSNRSVQQ